MRIGIYVRSDKKVCYACESRETISDRAHRNGIWYINHDIEGNVLCSKCYHSIFRNPKHDRDLWQRHKTWRRKSQKKSLIYGAKKAWLSFEIRKGICSECGRMNGVGRQTTDMHHIFYIPIVPWAFTVELCNQCHFKKVVLIRGQDGRYLSTRIKSRDLRNRQ